MAASLPLYKKVQSSLDTVLSHTRENLEGTRVIRAFNKQNNEIDSFNRDNEFLTNMQQVVGRISALTNPLTFIIINIATIAVIVSGGKQVYAGILTQGEVVALVNYMSQILVELDKACKPYCTGDKGSGMRQPYSGCACHTLKAS